MGCPRAPQNFTKLSRNVFNDDRNSLTPSDTSRAHAVLETLPAELVREVGHDATPRCPERVAQSDGTPVHVRFGAVQA